MGPGKIGALKLLMGGPSTAREIASALGLSYSRTATTLRELVEEGYCERRGRLVALSTNAKTEALKYLGTRYDLAELLRGPRELLLVSLGEPLNAEEIQRRTGLAQSTVYEALRHLMAMGVVLKRDDRVQPLFEEVG
jgi:DNA-binding IclR family transcriptional regulator